MTIAMQPIYTQTIGAGGATSVTFNNIPQTFTDLKVVVSARGAYGSNWTDVLPLTINGNYNLSARWIDATNSAASSTYTTSATAYGLWVREPAGTATTNTFGSAEIYIPNYTGSNYKSFTMDVATENNSASNYYLQMYAGLYPSANAITSLGFLISNGAIVQHSTFSLYGITKG